jgi:CubicO group peptidase (beta-lactamase class C family)
MKQRLYNFACTVLPKGKVQDSIIFVSNENERKTYELKQRVESVLRDYRTYGAVVAFFSDREIWFSLGYGKRDTENRITENTFFRSASVSKMVTSMGVLRLYEQDLIDLDEPLPLFEQSSYQVTFRELLSHTSIIQDGYSYNQGITNQTSLQTLLNQEDNFKQEDVWSYSNFGAGLIASLLEVKLKQSFEQIMQETVFKPLSITSSFYPPKNQVLSNSYEVFPVFKLSLDAGQRALTRPKDINVVDPERHFTLAQGNCWLSVDGAFKIAQALMNHDFLKPSTMEKMRKPIAAFGARDFRLSQGLGLFIVNTGKYPTFYGHQGLAYGGVHGIFFDPNIRSGFCLLSSGASLERNGVLTDINLALIDIWQEIFHG